MRHYVNPALRGNYCREVSWTDHVERGEDNDLVAVGCQAVIHPPERETDTRASAEVWATRLDNMTAVELTDEEQELLGVEALRRAWRNADDWEQEVDDD